MTSVSLTRLSILRQIKQGFGTLGIGIFCLGFLAGCGERISEHGHVINQAEMDIMEQPVAGINKTKSRVIYAFTFDESNSLQEIDLVDEKSGLNVAHIDSKTPTSGDTFGVIEQIFSNLKRQQANE